MPLTLTKIRFLRAWSRYEAGQVVAVDARFAEEWIRQRVAVPEPGEAVQEAAVLEVADVRTADLTPRRRARR